MDNYTFNMIELLLETVREWKKDVKARSAGTGFYQEPSASFALPAEDVDRLIELGGGELLGESREYKRLLQELSGSCSSFW